MCIITTRELFISLRTIATEIMHATLRPNNHLHQLTRAHSDNDFTFSQFACVRRSKDNWNKSQHKLMMMPIGARYVFWHIIEWDIISTQGNGARSRDVQIQFDSRRVLPCFTRHTKLTHSPVNRLASGFLIICMRWRQHRRASIARQLMNAVDGRIGWCGLDAACAQTWRHTSFIVVGWG